MFFKKAYPSVSVSDLQRLLSSKINLVDVREVYEYQSGHIRGAKNIPMGNLIRHAERLLKKDEAYYMICQSGSRSGRTCDILAKQGYQVINVSAGMGMFSMKHRESIA